MGSRIGLGPVFAFEWLVSSRKWRSYALRSLFVLGLLIGLIAVYGNSRRNLPTSPIRAQAWLGESLFYAIVGVQLALVMLAAPAATAGALCLDKARGTLLHLLATDLSDAEIVLGKLAARLLPTLMLVGCVLPVMALGTLLGGIDPIALTAAFLVTLGVAVLGCSLALTLSVWGQKTQEVLLVTYAVFIVWLLAYPLSQYLPLVGAWSLRPLDWMVATDPFRLAFAPYLRPRTARFSDAVLFLIGSIGVSTLLSAVCVWRMRRVTIRQSNRSLRKPRRWFRIRGRLPGPSLDWNPVLWAEWRRGRPTSWVGAIWAFYFGIALLFSAISAIQGGGGGFSAWVNGLQVCIGLLLLGVSASTSLSEERVRGSLDVLMTTPLSTAQIVWGKWLGAARIVPILCVLPAVAVSRRLVEGWLIPGSGRVEEDGVFLLTILGLIAAQGAALTGLGLLTATWVSRPGRAVALTVSVHAFMTVGWIFLCLTMMGGRSEEGPAMGSPFFGVGNLTFWMDRGGGAGSTTHERVLIAGIVWSILYLAAAIALLVLTLLTFNFKLGRIETVIARPRHLPRSLRKVPADVAFLADDEVGSPDAAAPSAHASEFEAEVGR